MWAIPIAVVVWIVVIAGAIGKDRTPAGPEAASPEPEHAPRAIAAPAEAPSAPAAKPPAAPAVPAPAPTPDQPPISVTSEQLRREYAANEVSADEHYRGKVLDVTGLVTSVKKDFRDQPYVELATGNMFQSVHARFAKDHDGVLREFLRGDKLIVRCVGNNVVIGSPQLKDCVLQHHYRRHPAE